MVGDRYSLLIVREIGYGYKRFNEIPGFTGAPRDVLSARLRSLEGDRCAGAAQVLPASTAL